MFLLRPTFLKKTLFTFRLIQDQPSSRLSSYVTTSSCPAALAVKRLSRSVRRLETNEAKTLAGAVIHLTIVTHSLGITKVILHCRELS